MSGPAHRNRPDRQRAGNGRRLLPWALAVIVAGGSGAAAWGLWSGGSAHAIPGIDPANYQAAAAAGPLPPEVVQCARCHMLPPAELLPRRLWPALLTFMHGLNQEYELGPAQSEDERRRVEEYYVGNSPSTEPALHEPFLESPIEFERQPLGAPPRARRPTISALTVTDLDRDGRTDVIVSDASARRVLVATMADGRWRETSLARIKVPARTEVADLNGDGALDVAVAVLGGMKPTEKPIGRLVLLLSDGDGGYDKSTVLRDVPRVCDVRAADLDGDGDLDLLVAMFGLYRTGGVGWLESTGDGYEYHEILARTGCSHVIPMQLDDDGRIDFVALFSQEHEEVLGFVNRGDGSFAPTVLFKAPHPMYGCSDLKAVDIDRDGDLDLLLANGDALDIDARPKPWHGVQWLENRGGTRFDLHDLQRFYGAYAAEAADFDLDGDIDIAVTSMMNVWGDATRHSIIWLENDGQQQFTAHPVDTAPTSLVSLAVADLDCDGRPDLIAGGMHVMPPYDRLGRLTSWLNRGR